MAAVIEEYWAWYQWWLAHPEEDFADQIEHGSHAQDILQQLQSELVEAEQTMRDGLSIVDLFEVDVIPGDLVSVLVEVRRDEPRERLDAATGEVVAVEREATGATGYWSWLLYPQPDGSHKVGILSPSGLEDV